MINQSKRLFYMGRLFLKMKTEKQIWVVILTMGSLIAWFAIRILKMKSLCAFLGKHQKNQPLCVVATAPQRDKAWSIGRTMDVVGKNVPWECKCLAQALCVKWLLDRYRIPSAACLGACLADVKVGMKAHAWLTVNEYVVTGAPEHQDYHVTSVFTQTFDTPAISY